MLAWPTKDPDDVLDYRLDWTAELAGDTITAATFSFVNQAGLAITSQYFDDTTTTVWLSGGNLDETAEILCHVTTAGSRQMDQTVSIGIASK